MPADVFTQVKAARGHRLRCKGWKQESLLRMLENNLENAEDPSRLIVYGGIAKAARNWESYHAIVDALMNLEDNETLAIQAGMPVAVFRTHRLAPRVVMALSNVIQADWERFYDLIDRNLTTFSSYTAGPWEYIGSQGVQQVHKEDRIEFTSLTPWPGYYICAEGRYVEDSGDTGVTRRAGVFVGPEFGTVARPDLAAAAREAADAGYDVLIACAFSYDAHAAEFEKLGRIPVLKARMNADLHMAGDLKNTGKGNLFVIFGEPDIDILEDGEDTIRVRINGVDVFHPNTGEVRSDSADGIACWFVDTDYNEESFFVRHAYFLGANDPYKALKTTLKAEIDLDAWATLNCDTSRPFSKPASGRIAVKVINHLGDEAMKVFRV